MTFCGEMLRKMVRKRINIELEDNMKKIWQTLIGSAFLASAALAHGHEQHVMGTVTNVTAKAIVVELVSKKPDGVKESATVSIEPTTTFEKNGHAAAAKDVKVGDRVVIHAGAHGDHLQAHTVKIGVAPSTPQH
jgi:hypothetical protein